MRVVILIVGLVIFAAQGLQAARFNIRSTAFKTPILRLNAFSPVVLRPRLSLQPGLTGLRLSLPAVLGEPVSVEGLIGPAVVSPLAQVRAAASGRDSGGDTARAASEVFDGGERGVAGEAAAEVPVLVDFTDSQTADRLSGPALRAFFRMAEIWGLDDGEQSRLLSDPAPEVLEGWKRGDVTRLNPDQLIRISYLLGIFKALRTLFYDYEREVRWLRAENEGFENRAGIEVMLSGIEGLTRVRRYLDYWAYNGW